MQLSVATSRHADQRYNSVLFQITLIFSVFVAKTSSNTRYKNDPNLKFQSDFSGPLTGAGRYGPREPSASMVLKKMEMFRFTCDAIKPLLMLH